MDANMTELRQAVHEWLNEMATTLTRSPMLDTRRGAAVFTALNDWISRVDEEDRLAKLEPDAAVIERAKELGWHEFTPEESQRGNMLCTTCAWAKEGHDALVLPAYKLALAEQTGYLRGRRLSERLALAYTTAAGEDAPGEDPFRAAERRGFRRGVVAAAAPVVTPELLAGAIAHRAIAIAEHDPAAGKQRGDCAVCATTWPCATAEAFMPGGTVTKA